MSTQNTPGRLALELVESDSGTIKHLCPCDKDGMSVLTVVEHEGVQFAAVYLDDDARRLVACWNACEGISTDELEKTGGAAVGWTRTASKLIHATTQRDELLAVLRGVQKRCAPHGFVGMDGQYLKEVGAAIAKAEGPTP